MSYKIIHTKKGTKYMANGRFTSRDKIPVLELAKLEGTNGCIVCGGSVEHHRNVLGVTVDLCDEHYFNVSYGALAGKLKEGQHAKATS